MPNKMFDKRLVDARGSQPLTLHPVAEMREAAQVSPDGAPCIALALQSPDIRSDEFAQWVVQQPVTPVMPSSA
jgi:hypothetical protein